MKKRMGICRLVVLLFSLSVLCGGCQWISPLPEESSAPEVSLTEEQKIKQAYNENRAAFVQFYKSTDPRYLYVPYEDVLNYESIYPDTNGTWFRNQLSGEDLCIYNGILYALEHGYTGVELYVEDNKRDFYYIRQAVSMDSPLLEQNKNRLGERIYDNPTNHFGRPVYFRFEQFTTKRSELKKQAWEKCVQIVEEMPDSCRTQWEKAEYLYQYVCDHVEYVAYDRMLDEDHLYDAVIKGQAVCDGYSNMLNLLFNLAGIESVEVMGDNLKVGHTWVVAKIGDQFYNFDPTYEDGENSVPASRKRIFFGFSDEVVDMLNWRHEDTRPKCTDRSRDYQYADLIVSNVTDAKEIDKIVDITEKRAAKGQYVTLVVAQDTMNQKRYDEFWDRYGKQVQGISELKTAWIPAGKNHTLLIFTVTPA